MPHVHVLHVDGGILENANCHDASSSATVGSSSTSSNTSGFSSNAITAAATSSSTINAANSTSSNITSSGSSSFAGVTNLLTSNSLSHGGSTGSGASNVLNNSLTFENPNPINIISRTASGNNTSSVSLPQLNSGGNTTSSSVSNSKLYLVNPLSPPAISGIGCAPMQDSNSSNSNVNSATGTDGNAIGGTNPGSKSKLNISSVINNCNVSKSDRKNNFGHHSSVMTHKTQMQMALQRKMNNLNLKQMSGGGAGGGMGMVSGTGVIGLEHGLLAEGIAVRGQSNFNPASISTKANTNSHPVPVNGSILTHQASNINDNEKNTVASVNNYNNSAVPKRLHVLLPQNESSYAVRVPTPKTEVNDEDPQHTLKSPVSTGTPLSTDTQSYSPLLPSSGFSSPLIHPKYNANAKSTPNTTVSSSGGSDGSLNNLATVGQQSMMTRDMLSTPSTSDSFNYFYQNSRNKESYDQLLMEDNVSISSAPTSESCSPHVRLCGSRASCGPMWTKEDLTMLDMVYNQANGCGKGSKQHINSGDSGISFGIDDEDGIDTIISHGGNHVAKKLLLLGREEDDGNVDSMTKKDDNDDNLPIDAMKALQMHPTTA